MIAAIFALASPLVNTVAQIGLDFWMVVTWSAFAVLSALVEFLLLVPFKRWNVRHGYRAWSTLALGEADFAFAPWQKIWWWILLSFTALIGGVASNMLFTLVLSDDLRFNMLNLHIHYAENSFDLDPLGRDFKPLETVY
jgi:hypothetical protein